MNYVFVLYSLLMGSTPAAPSPDVTKAPAVERAAPVPPLSCEMREATRDGRTAITAVVHSRMQAAGDFEFDLGATDGRQNKVRSSTGDSFSIHAGESQVLNGPTLHVGPGAKFVGGLRMLDAGGKLLASCSL